MPSKPGQDPTPDNGVDPQGFPGDSDTHVLVVEDDPDHAFLIARKLKAAFSNIRVARVDCVAAAKTWLAAERCDLVLTDLGLPDATGVEAVESLRVHALPAPVVVLTSNADESLGIAAIQKGAQDYLEKDELTPRMLRRVAWHSRERQRTNLELERLARHDPLTGLLNRRAFQEVMNNAKARALRTGKRSYLMLLDLDGFKEVNDQRGHEAGDAVLRSTAQTLLECIRETDSALRIGGDEFAVVLEGVSTDEEAHRVGQRILLGLAKCGTSASMGIARIEDLDRVVAAADQALYQAKSEGGSLARVSTAPPNSP